MLFTIHPYPTSPSRKKISFSSRLPLLICTSDQQMLIIFQIISSTRFDCWLIHCQKCIQNVFFSVFKYLEGKWTSLRGKSIQLILKVMFQKGTKEVDSQITEHQGNCKWNPTHKSIRRTVSFMTSREFLEIKILKHQIFRYLLQSRPLAMNSPFLVIENRLIKVKLSTICHSSSVISSFISTGLFYM